MTEFRYDTQLLIEGTDLDEDVIGNYFRENFKGDCLLAVGDETLIKKYITIPTSRGRCLNTAPRSVRYSILSSRIWTGSQEDSRVDAFFDVLRDKKLLIYE